MVLAQSGGIDRLHLHDPEGTKAPGVEIGPNSGPSCGDHSPGASVDRDRSLLPVAIWHGRAHEGVVDGGPDGQVVTVEDATHEVAEEGRASRWRAGIGWRQ